MSVFRREPAFVRAIVGPGERVLDWCEDAGAVVVASDRALYLSAPEPLRLPWDLIQNATFESEVLTVEGRAARGQPLRTWRVRLLAPRRVPDVVHERVRASILASHHVNLVSEGGARFVARRAPGASGPVSWTVTFDPGLDPADPRLRELADEALGRLRSTLGV